MTARPDPRHAIRPTIPAQFVVEMLGQAEDSAAIAAAAGIDPSALALPRFRVSVRQFVTLYHAVCRARDDEFFGFLRRPVPRGAYLTLLRLATGCTDVSACLDAYRRFYRLFDRHDYWETTSVGDATRLAVSMRSETQAASGLFSVAMLLTVCRTLGWLTAAHVRVDAVTLDPRFSKWAPEARYLFGCDPTFSPAACEVLIASPKLDAPVVRRPADVDAHGPVALEQMLGPAPRDTWADEVRSQLAAADPFASTRLEDLAAALGISRQTLSRRLADHGLTLQRLKDDLRRDHAIALLTKTQRSVADIAAAVGYSEPSAFVRAFRSWVGVAPGRYRLGET